MHAYNQCILRSKCSYFLQHVFSVLSQNEKKHSTLAQDREKVLVYCEQGMSFENEIHFMWFTLQHICCYHGDIRGADTEQTKPKLQQDDEVCHHCTCKLGGGGEIKHIYYFKHKRRKAINIYEFTLYEFLFGLEERKHN